MSPPTPWRSWTRPRPLARSSSAGGLDTTAQTLALTYWAPYMESDEARELAVVQGGLTTCMELTANRRPFLYFPLRHHFEQNFHVAHRLGRYGAGRCMDFETDGPSEIAAAIAEEIGRDVDYRPVERDGAARAAALIGELL